MMNKEDLKIIFFGTPEFAVESLDSIIKNGYNVVAAVTMPDKPAGRGHKMYHSPVKEYAVTHNIPLLQPAKLKNEEFLDTLRSYNADLFIVIAFRMLPEAVWQMPRLGTFNLHASLLPRYRGAAPINWAVINGDSETGVTTFFLKHEIDTGDIISQERIEILPTDNVGDVHDKLMALGARLTVDTIDHIIKGDLKTIPQDSILKGTEATPAPKIFKDTCHIDWNKDATQVHNLVRGLSPYPAAWSEIHAVEETAGFTPINVKVFSTVCHEATLSDATAGNVGSITLQDGKMFVTCGDGRSVEITELQPAGKRRMKTDEFLRGARLPEKCEMR